MDWTLILSQLFGGLTLFMYGMHRMNKALKTLAGDKLKDLITTFSLTHFRGFISGIIVSGILQSSTVVTVMLVSFVSTGVMTFSQSLGILLGTGIGSTFISQIVALRLTKYCLLILTIGYLLQFFVSQLQFKSYRIQSYVPRMIPMLPTQKRVHQLGQFLFGMGLLFFGMEIMSDSVLPLRSHPPFVNLLTSIRTPLLGLLVSIFFTLLIQSSSATISVVIALASQNLIDIDESIIFVLGANIGTCGTALLAALGKHPAAMRVALAHVITKILGTILLLPFLGWFKSSVLLVSPNDDTSESLARQIANAHTLFNLFTALLFLPFLDAFAGWMVRLVPEKNEYGLLPLSEVELEQINGQPSDNCHVSTGCTT
eukprot:TRINITY_DN14821_c0_g1_i1.p1 TRINITY_DN14821_c0_g1~~TRINITY_DN14821_c0_g1_i1.p1  ORF type:complete len:371 (+),score=50.20 TRINITY_DN14821_c0_g1_i1:47-1159(+)